MDIVASNSLLHLSDDGSNDKKLFQCRGYGNCRLTFTQSKHLTRHERKHTGEKPYDCTVPDCRRKFSRFNNMMQNTQTHHYLTGTNDINGYDDVDRVPDLVKSKASAPKRKKNTNTTATSTTKKKRSSKNKSRDMLLKKKRVAAKTTIEPKKRKKNIITKDNHPAAAAVETVLDYDYHMSTLMDEIFLLSDSSLLTSDEEEFEDDDIIIDDCNSHSNNKAASTRCSIIGHEILPHLANYLVDHPDEPLENFYFQFYHRLSRQDLLYTIESLAYSWYNKNSSSSSSSTGQHSRKKGSGGGGSGGEIYITIAEYEALQGLSYFTCQK